MLLAYAIVDAVPSLVRAGTAHARGVGDGPYVVAAERSQAPSPSLEELRAHHGVVLAAAREVACLPCRFGETFVDEAAALDWIARRREALASALERVRDRWEFDLRLPDDAAPPVLDAQRPGAGTRYLERLRERYGARDASRLERAANAVRRTGLVTEVEVDAAAGSLAFLVARNDAAEFAARVRGWVPVAGARWSGPWPAYSFAAAWVGGDA